jgi:DNA-binding transcriptional LysR family regulator
MITDITTNIAKRADSSRAGKRGMNLRQIEAFKAVMQFGSITLAADALGLTQPTISKLIAQLEGQTKLKLFDRTRARLMPRPEAIYLLKNFETVLRALDEVGRNARHLAQGRLGHLRIATIPPLSAEFLPKAVADFVKKRSGVQVTIHVWAPSYVKEWVADHQADLGFVSDGPQITGTVTSLFQDSPGAICILPRGHELGERRSLKPADFEGMPFISLGRATTLRRKIDQTFRDHKIDRRIAAETNHFTTACALVSEGVGVSIVDPFTALYFHKAGAGLLRAFEPDVQFTVNLIRPASHAMPLLANEFIASLSQAQKTMNQTLKTLLRDPSEATHP